MSDPVCPVCQGAMWNNIATKKNPKQPDYKCKDKSCAGVIWPPRNGQPARAGTSVSQEKVAQSAGPYIHAIDGPAPAPAPTTTVAQLDRLFMTYSLIEAHVLATSVHKFVEADIGPTPESITAQIHTLFIAAQKAGIV